MFLFYIFIFKELIKVKKAKTLFSLQIQTKVVVKVCVLHALCLFVLKIFSMYVANYEVVYLY